MSKKVNLDDLGLGGTIDVEKRVKEMPPIEFQQPVARPAKQQSAPAPKQVPQPKRVEYPWLVMYMQWLRFAGFVGNVIFIVVAFVAVATGDLGLFVEGIFGVLCCNFLFVIAALVQLALDAKSDLSTVARKLK